MTKRTDDWFSNEQTENYQRCWKFHSEDGCNPELDYNELIYTILELRSKISELEALLDRQEEYQQEQND